MRPDSGKTPARPTGATDLAGRRPQAHLGIRAVDLSWVFVGPGGVRAGWLIFSVLLPVLPVRSRSRLYRLYDCILTCIATASIDIDCCSSQSSSCFSQCSVRRHHASRCPAPSPDYNLRDARALRHFISGTIVGVASLSALSDRSAWEAGPTLGAHLEPIQTRSVRRRSGLLTFLLVGCFEEGMISLLPAIHADARHQLLVGPGIGFADSAFRSIVRPGDWRLGCLCYRGASVSFPVFLLQLKRAASSGFWQAAWALVDRASDLFTPATTVKTGSASSQRLSSASSSASASGSPGRHGGPSVATPPGIGPRPISTARPTAASSRRDTCSAPRLPEIRYGAEERTALRAVC